MDFSKILILQVVILFVVLESDLGRKKVGWFRIARPVIVGVAIVPAFFTSLPSGRNDLLLQGAGALAGLILGLLCVAPAVVGMGFVPDYRGWWTRRQGKPGKPAAVSVAGVKYASIWVVISAARLVFAYTSQHTFPIGLHTFLLDHSLSADALTNSLTFLALGMDIFRSIGLFTRASSALHRGREMQPTRVAASR